MTDMNTRVRMKASRCCSFFFLCAKVYICSWNRYDKFLSNTRTGYAKADTKGNEICAAKIRKCLVRLPP